MTYRTITLCGSLKFEKDFLDLQVMLERKGHVVLSITKGEGATPPTPEEKSIIDKVHFKKIMLSDCIIVINPGHYIGDSTRNEIEFARLTNKEIFYLYNSAHSKIWDNYVYHFGERVV